MTMSQCQVHRSWSVFAFAAIVSTTVALESPGALLPEISLQEGNLTTFAEESSCARCIKKNQPCTKRSCAACDYCQQPPANTTASLTPVSVPPSTDIPSPDVDVPAVPNGTSHTEVGVVLPGAADFSSGPTAIVTRRALHNMTVEEQERFLRTIAKMQEGGARSPFAQLGHLHGGTETGLPSHCVHNAENFLHWHRVALHNFETKLQDAYEALYGDRDIALPYWDWTLGMQGTSTPGADEILHPEVKDLADTLCTPSVMASIFGTSGLPAGSWAEKAVKKGLYAQSDHKIYTHKTWPSTFMQILYYAGVANDKKLQIAEHGKESHRTVTKAIEKIHNNVHKAFKAPMTNLMMASYHVYFYLHHAQVDRIWEAYIHFREQQDGSREPLEEEFRTTNPEVYNRPLTPFVKYDGSGWTSAGTYDTMAFNYVYDSLPDPTVFANLAYGGSGFAWASHLASQSVKSSTNLEAAWMTPIEALLSSAPTNPLSTIPYSLWQSNGTTTPRKIARITLGKAAACTLDESQDSFVAHFFLVPKDGPPLSPLPTKPSELGGVQQYVGCAGTFAGLKNSTHPDTVEFFVQIDRAPEEYDVIVLYDDDDHDDESGGQLYEEPVFWRPTVSCNGKRPKPDASWITLEVVGKEKDPWKAHRHYDA